MGIPTSEVGSTLATTGRGDHEVHNGHVVALEKKYIVRIVKWRLVCAGHEARMRERMSAQKKIDGETHWNSESSYVRTVVSECVCVRACMCVCNYNDS
jgi:hypothetical protein